MPGFEEHAQAGLKALSEKDFTTAVESLILAVEAAPDRPDMRNALAIAYLSRGEVGSAIPQLEKAIELAEPFDAPEHQEMKRSFYMSLGTAYQLADRLAEARHQLETTVARWPGAVDARIQLAALLLKSCQLEDGLAVYRALLDLADVPDEVREASTAILGATQAFLDNEDADGKVFLEAHQQSYQEYFDNVVAQQVAEGWIAEAARMARPDVEGGEPKPFLAEGARPYAQMRVDIVNPADGTVAGIYSDTEPMIVALEGLEPLAQAQIMFPWRGWDFEVFVCSQVPWHWLQITVEFEREGTEEQVIEWLDDYVGDWYQAGFFGEFGEKDSGRFHYITDPQFVAPRAVSYIVDLGRSRLTAIDGLMKRLVVLHDVQPIRRVLFGAGLLPD